MPTPYPPMPNRDDYPDDSPPRLSIGPRAGLLLGLVMVLAVVFVLSLAFGSVNIPPRQILVILTGGEPTRPSWANIILKFRLPKATTAILAGAGLGVSGLLMQTFFRNPLAGPYVLGVSSGASLGVALVVLSTTGVGSAFLTGFGLTGDILLATAAAFGAGGTLFVVLVIAGRVQHSTTLLIVGLMMGYFVSAIVSLLMFFAVPERIQAYVSWTFGNFGGVTWEQMPVLAGGVTFGLIGSFLLAKSLNALLLGERYAHSLGLNIRFMRMAIVGATALLAGTVTAFCGPIGFIGIAVPHLSRTLFHTADHRVLVPATALTGATVALMAAILAEAPGQTVILPVNAVTALMGAPVVMAVILQRRTSR